ncbi:beta-propeller domain-containing protein [Candidatus Parcubacteria bacterium]|nr:beta-propeller domain-containing protein [Candidatus Parcubacteria bacterium]
MAVKFEGKDNIYVLDSKLKILSKIENLNIPEEISSVRFLGNKCFISTLNEEGPVYVIDLLFAQSVKFKLESKISTNFAHLYLISKEKVLGIEKEKEKEKTKISLLDLNSTESPKELSSYIVKDSLFDRQKEFKIFQGKEDLIFVGEGGNKTYFISIKQNQILMKTIDQKGIEGAVSDQNFFYLIFEDKIFVFDKSNLEKIKEIPI